MFKLSRNNAGDAKDVAALRAAVFDELTGLWNKSAAEIAVGDVAGPSSAVSGHIPLFSGATGKIIEDSGIAPSDLYASACATQEVTTADVTITDVKNGTLILTGALTGNRVVYLPAAVWKKTIICDCTGSYYVRVLATGQSSGGVYLAPGDAADVYCNGTDAKSIRILRNARAIVQSKTCTFTSGPYENKIPLSSVTWVGDALAEIAANRYTPKNSGAVNISGYYAPGSMATAIIIAILYENGTPIMHSDRNFLNTASSEARLGFSFTFNAAAGKYYEIALNAGPGTYTDSRIVFTRITPL